MNHGNPIQIPWNPRKRNQELEPSISVLGAESTSNKIWWGCRGLVEAGPSPWTPWNPWKVEAGTGFRCGKIIGKSWENLWETMGKALNVWKIIHRSWENMVVYWENHHVRTIYHKLTTQKWERFIAHIYGDLGDGLWHCFTHMTEIVGKYGTTPLHLWRFMAIEESSG
jgi:hypothetical protein